MINTSLIAPLPADQQAQPTFGNFSDAFRMGVQRADPLERLKRLSLEQGLQMQGFNLQKALEDRQKQVDGEAMARELAPKIQSFIKAGDPMAAKNEMLGLTAMHHELVNSPYWNSLGKSVDDSIGFANEKMKLQSELAMRQAQKAHYEALNADGGSKSTALGANLVIRDQVVKELETAKASGNKPEIDRLQSKLAFIDGSRNMDDKARISVLVREIGEMTSRFYDPMYFGDKQALAREIESRKEELSRSRDSTPFVPGVGGGSGPSNEPVWNYSPGRGLVK